MSLARNVVFALALGAPFAAVGLAPVAHAETPASAAEGFVGLPAPSARAEGEPVDVYFALWSASGPTQGLVAKATSTSGTVGAVTEAAPGLYRVVFQPGARGPATVVVKGKDPATKRPLEASVAIEVGARRGAVAVGVAPSSLVLGRDVDARISVDGAGLALRMRTSAGTLGDPTLVPASGAFEVKLAAPADRPPRIAIVAVSDARDPLATASHLALPMSGAIDFPIKGEPGASVVLEISGEKFGPVVIGGDGRGRVPVVVPPGVGTATRISVKDGSETRDSIDLKIPEAKRLLLYPLPAALPADGREVPLQVVVVKPDGSPDLDAKPVFTVSGGNVTAAVSAGAGVHRATWKLPTTGSTANVSVSLGSPLQTDAMDVTLAVPMPASLTVSSSPETVGAGTEFRVVVGGLDAAGKPTELGEPVVDFDGATSLSSGREGLSTSRDGASWAFVAKAAEAGRVRATAHWKVPSSPNAPALVTLVPDRYQVANDGAARVEVLAVAVDAAGLPVADRKITLSVEGGGGRFEPAEVTTRGDGTARSTYIAGKDAAYVGARATSADLSQVVVLGQFPVGKAPVKPPPHPAPAVAGLIPSLVVPRTGEGAEMSAVVSPVQRVTLAVEGVAAPGATVVLVASAVDGTGKPLAAFVPTLTASGGTLSPPEVGADGTVKAILSIPADFEGAIDVEAAAGGRTAKVVVGDDDASDAWGAPAALVPAPVPAPTPVAEVAPVPAPEVEPPREPRPPREPSDHPWVRARGNAVFGTYRYAQSPSAEPGPVLPSTLAVGGEGGGAPATPIGAEGDLRLWLDPVGVPYVGVHGQLRGAAYAISSQAFSNSADDALWNGSIDLVGRYPFELAGGQYWAGAKVGYQYGDFLTFLGDLEPGSTIEFLGLPVSGLGIGPEIGADIGPVHVIAAYTLGLARGSQPYSNGFDFEAGWAPVDHLFLSAGVTTVVRDAILTGADSGLDRGAIQDSSLAVKVGLGVSL